MWGDFPIGSQVLVVYHFWDDDEMHAGIFRFTQGPDGLSHLMATAPERVGNIHIHYVSEAP